MKIVRMLCVYRGGVVIVGEHEIFNAVPHEGDVAVVVEAVKTRAVAGHRPESSQV